MRSISPIPALLALPLALSLSAPAAIGQTGHFGGVQSVIGSGFSSPGAVAVDAKGDIFIADTGNRQIVEETLSGGVHTQTVVIGSLPSQLGGVAVDSTGNLYFTNQSIPSLQKLAYVNGAYASMPTTIATDLGTPVGVAVDASGNVYVADSRLKEILKFINIGGQYIQTAPVNGLNSPTGVAVDGNGDLFIGDSLANQVFEVVLTNGTYGRLVVAVNGISKPSEVAVDAFGNLAVAAAGGLFYETLVSGSYTGMQMASNVNNPLGVAFDPNGNIVLADTGDSQVLHQILPQNQTFGSVQIPATSAPQSLVFVFDTSGTLNGSAPTLALLSGKTGLDYAVGAGSGTTCTASATVKAGGTCLVAATFTPQLPGQRKGAVELLGSSGQVAATAYINGTGLSSQAAFAPLQTQISSGLYAQGVAVDGAGNLFITDLANNRIVEEVFSGGIYTQSPTLIGSGLGSPTAVAVDGAGNLFVVDFEHQRIVEEVNSLGSYTQSTTPVASGIGYPTGIAVDGAGNVYIATGGTVLKEVWTGSGYRQSPTPVAAVAGTTDVAVDAAGVVYFDTDSSSYLALFKAVPTGSGYTTSQLPVANPNQPFQPGGLAVDSVGDLFIANPVNGGVDEEIPINGVYTVTRTFSGTLVPTSVAVDGAGNVYLVDVLSNQVFADTVAAPPSLTFASTPVGVTSSDSPQSITTTNIGNQPLIFSTQGSLTNSNFFESANTCTSALPANGSCAFSLGYQPFAVRTHAGAFAIQDNSLAGTGTSTQTASLFGGAATQGTQTITFSPLASGTFVSGAVVPLNATASSGLAISYTASATGSLTATISGATVVLGGSGTGTVSVTASQPGTPNFSAATPVTYSFTATIVATPATSATLPATAVGSSSIATVNVVLNANGTLASVQGLLLGAPQQDYSAALASGSCAIGTAYPAGTVCSVTVKFSPLHPSVRMGAVQLLDFSGNVLGSSYLSGTGLGPQVAFAPVQKPIGSGIGLAEGIAVNGAGDVFVAQGLPDCVAVEVFSNGVYTQSPTCLGSGLSLPVGVAVDGAGNVFIVDANARVVVEEIYSNGAYTQSTATIGSGLSGPAAIAIDAAGNLYVSDSSSGRVVEEVWTGTGYQQASSPVATGINAPQALCVDVAGNVYIVNWTGTIKKAAPNGNGFTVSNLTFATPFSYADSIAVDVAGNLYIGDYTAHAVDVEVPVNGVYTLARTIGSGVDANALALDGAGNVYIADSDNNRAWVETVTAPPSLSFPATAAGVTSSPITTTITNNGDRPLTLPVPATGTDPQTGANFALETNTDTTCPVVPANGTAGTLAASASCVLSYVFAPTQTGTLTSTSIVTDNSLNVAGATQTITLTGTATQGTLSTQTIAFSPSATAAYPGMDTLTASASSGLPVTYTLNSGPATLSGSTLTFTGTGTVSVTASQAGNVQYAAAAPVTGTITVTLAESFISWNPATTKIYTGTTLAGVLDAVDSIPATIDYTASPLPSGSPVSVTSSTVLTAGNYDLTAVVTPSILNYAQVSDSLLFQVQNMNVFVANLGGNVLSLYNNGTQQSAPTSGGGVGTAVDSSGYVWSIDSSGSSLSKFTDSGALAGSYPVSGMAQANALAIDGAGTVWVVNSQAGTVSPVANSGAALSVPVGEAAGLSGPQSISVDTAGSLWIANGGSNTVTEIIGVATPTTPLSTAVSNGTPAAKP